MPEHLSHALAYTSACSGEGVTSYPVPIVAETANVSEIFPGLRVFCTSCTLSQIAILYFW